MVYGLGKIEFHLNLKTEDEPLISQIDTDFLRVCEKGVQSGLL